MEDSTGGTGRTNPTGEPEWTPCVFIWIRVAKSLACVCVCRVLMINICIFVLFMTIEQPCPLFIFKLLYVVS
jgi:hypothetical protein